MNIKDYINSNLILQVGQPIEGDVCVETIVSNPVEFVHVVKSNGYFIQHILWWERAKLSEGPLLGGGGTLDPRSPNEYFFAETQLERDFAANTSADEYIEYIRQTQETYGYLELYPGFDVSSRTGDGLREPS